MSFFPGSLVTASHPSSSFSPLFRLLDDFEQHSRGSTDGRHSRAIRTFTPKFDVKEVAESYELHGELPGIDQKDIEIEFSDDQTITIKGRTERSYTSGNPPAGFVESGEAQASITQGESHNNSHKATVEDEDASKDTTSTEVTAHNGSQEQPKGPEAKYWVSERSIGEFSRSFTFPVRVDQDRVNASMKNGILSIVVPKAKKQSARKITIG